MGFLLFDYFFKSDPFEFNFRLLTLNGFWPLQTKNKIYDILFRIYAFLCLFSITSMLFIQILDLYLLRNDAIKFTKNLCATAVTYASVVKHITILYRIENILNLHRKLKEYKNSRHDPEELKIISQASKRMSQATKGIYALAVPCITAWMLYPGLEASNQKAVPFPYRLPIDDWFTPLYEILYTYQSMSMVGFMVVILSNDLVYYGMVIQVIAKYEILFEKLKALDTIVNSNLKNQVIMEDNGRLCKIYDSDAMERARSVAKECFVFHQTILEQIEQLKLIYGIPYLTHFMAAITLVGTIIVDLVVVSKGFKLQMLQRVMYSANGLWDTFLCCYFTSDMQEKSHELRRVVYSTPWYELCPTVRKDLLMILLRTKKAPVVKVGNYFPLNLGTFLQFLKMTYNITALLYQTIKV